MTIDEVPDRIAELCGWTKHVEKYDRTRHDPNGEWCESMCFYQVSIRGCNVTYWTHADHGNVMGENAPGNIYTLDGLARLWKERLGGWVWVKEWGEDSVVTWSAWNDNRDVHVPDTGDWLADFTRLTLAALEEEAKK